MVSIKRLIKKLEKITKKIKLTDKIVLILFLIFVYEILFFFKISNKINENFYTLKKIFKLFSSEQLSDLRKEKLLVIYSKN